MAPTAEERTTITLGLVLTAARFDSFRQFRSHNLKEFSVAEMTFQGHSRSSAMPPSGRSYMTSY